jgi:hypothetical protein
VADTFQHKDALFDSYGFQSAKWRFRLYQGRKKAADNMANLLIHGTKKYNKKKRKRGKKGKKRGSKDKSKRQKHTNKKRGKKKTLKKSQSVLCEK